MAVRETSLIAFRDYQIRLTHDLAMFYYLIKGIGPTYDHVILNRLHSLESIKASEDESYHVREWLISDVTGRRNDLIHRGCVYCLGTYQITLPKRWDGDKERVRSYMIWDVVNEVARSPLMKFEKAPPENRTRDAVIAMGIAYAAKQKEKDQRRKEKKPKSKTIVASNRDAVVWVQDGSQKRTRPTDQGKLF